MATAIEEFGHWMLANEKRIMRTIEPLLMGAYADGAQSALDKFRERMTPGATGQDSTSTEGKESVGTDKEATQQS